MKHLAPTKSVNLFLALLMAISLVSMILIATPNTAVAQTSLSQCNGTDNVGGQAVDCTYTVTNNITESGTTSTVSLRECHGAANAPQTMVCTSSTVTSSGLVTSIDQCNGSGNGGWWNGDVCC